MNREIKFRSAHYNFDGTFSHFSYWGMIDHKGNFSTDCFTSPSSASGTQRKFEEQFTGLKDKNNVEIYDGDILTFDPHEWNRSSMKPESDWDFPFWEVEWDLEDGEWSTGGGTTRECSTWKEVVGNIHENPELLDGN